ncbi:MAG TPA: hypothetical protein VJY66_02815 [Acholeplasma sp.]|nr:hypothetical protein [Acholeplasma sp.]
MRDYILTVVGSLLAFVGVSLLLVTILKLFSINGTDQEMIMAGFDAVLYGIFTLISFVCGFGFLAMRNKLTNK